MWGGESWMGWLKEKAMCWIISSANSSELSDIVRALLKRYAELFADEEVVFLSMPKYDREERQRIILGVLDLEQHWK